MNPEAEPSPNYPLLTLKARLVALAALGPGDWTKAAAAVREAVAPVDDELASRVWAHMVIELSLDELRMTYDNSDVLFHAAIDDCIDVAGDDEPMAVIAPRAAALWRAYRRRRGGAG